MTRTLTLAPSLSLPLEAVTETVAVLGKRGAGKTNTAVVMAEEMLAVGQQVVIIDPTDVWWGLKSSADGTSEGFPVVVLGGRHGDVPLAAGDGATVADFIVDEGTSCVLSVRHFESQADARRFVTEVCNRLYHRKGEVERQTPLHLIIDEASTFVPQRVMAEETRCVSAIQRLVRQGRSSGFGVTLIDQRPATVNKDVLTQLELLVCHRVTSPQDRKALDAWIEQHDGEGQATAFLDSLAALPQGTAWFWSPGWLNLFKKVAVRARRTFDSSRTPKAGERAVAPQKVAPIDLDALKGKLASAIERAKAEDPKTLQARIRELERQLATPQAPRGEDPRVRLLQDVIAGFVSRGVPGRLDALRQRIEAFHSRVEVEHQEYLNELHDVRMLTDALGKVELQGNDVPPSMPSITMRGARVTPSRFDARTHVRGDLAATTAKAVDEFVSTRRIANGAPRQPRIVHEISRPQQRMLDALRSFELMGVDRLSRGQLAVFSDQSPKSSGFEKNLSTLRTKGLLDYPSVGWVQLTENGRDQVLADVAPATLTDLHDAWRAKLSGPQGRMLDVLTKCYPRAVLRSQLAQLTDQSPSSSGWEKNLSTMRSLGILDYADRTHAVATALLFPPGLR